MVWIAESPGDFTSSSSADNAFEIKQACPGRFRNFQVQGDMVRSLEMKYSTYSGVFYINMFHDSLIYPEDLFIR